MSLRLPRLADDPDAPFPPVASALREPDGLLAFGGDLHPRRLLNAYRHGIFPWPSDGYPLLWWCPDPRTVFRTDAVRLASKFRRGLRRSDWVVRADTAFEQVIAACAQAPRPGQDGTWINDELREAYVGMHRLGHAHSIEVYDGTTLVGGLYGIAIGRMFFGESMYSARPGGSKVAIAALARHLHAWGWPLLDGQVENPHLLSLGAVSMPRTQFLAEVERLTALPGFAPAPWTAHFGDYPARALADPAVDDEPRAGA